MDDGMYLDLTPSAAPDDEGPTGRSNGKQHGSVVAGATVRGRLTNILIVDDDTSDANHLIATLRIIVGYDATIRCATTLGTARDALSAGMPECVFLDDHLRPQNADASTTIPFLRRCGFRGPIIVVSGFLTHPRVGQLRRLGAVDVIAKDDLDSFRLRKALIRAQSTPSG